MWNAVVLAVLISLAGLYATRNYQTLDHAHAELAQSSAADMGIYRQAVIGYFRDHDVLSTGVTLASLKSGGYLPSWSRLYQQSTPLEWSNYRDAGGVIYVYGVNLPTPDPRQQNLMGELLQLAQNSILLGFYRSGAANLQSPVYGDTGIPIAAISTMSIPDGAPIWIATTK